MLQLYWFGLIVKVAVKLMRGQGVEDIRSDDEDEPTSLGERAEREENLGILGFHLAFCLMNLA